MEAAMALAMIRSQPHLSRVQSYSGLQEDDGSSSSGELLRGGGTASSGGRSSSSSVRRRSYGDVAILSTGGGAGGAPFPRSSNAPPRIRNGRGRTTNEHAADANFHVSTTTDEHAAEVHFDVSAAPGYGYVSFEDVIGPAALYRNGSSRRLLEATIDSVVRTESRLYVRDNGGSHRRRQPSPGPLGTRRGSVMHEIVKKYVHPLQDFLTDIFCCVIPRDHR